MASRTDIEHWILQMALGDRTAFEALYGATSAKLFGLILRVLKDRHQSEEVLQEVYLKVWRHAGRYQVNGLSPMSWLITIARNTAIDRLRAQRSEPQTGSSDLMDAVADGNPDPEEQAIRRSETLRLDECMGELEPAHAKALRGAYLDGATYADLAEQAGIPLNTMRTWLRRSLIKLRECLTR